MKFTVNLVMGDADQLGHGNTERLTIKSNMNAQNIRAAYSVGCGYVGFNLTEEIGIDSSGCILYDNQYWMLCKAGVPVNDILNESNLLDELDEKPKFGSKARYRLSIDDFKELWLNIAKLGAPNLKWEEYTETSILIGGYALLA